MCHGTGGTSAPTDHPPHPVSKLSVTVHADAGTLSTSTAATNTANTRLLLLHRIVLTSPREGVRLLGLSPLDPPRSGRRQSIEVTPARLTNECNTSSFTSNARSVPTGTSPTSSRIR